MPENTRAPQPTLQETINKDNDQAVRIAHTIKGLAANIGASKLHRLAEQLEITLDHTLLPAFDEALNEVIDGIRASSLFQTQTTATAKRRRSPPKPVMRYGRNCLNN